MAKCQLTGKTFLTGNLISHSNRKTKTVRRANILKKRVFDPAVGHLVTIHVSARALRTLTRKGWDAFEKKA